MESEKNSNEKTAIKPPPRPIPVRRKLTYAVIVILFFVGVPELFLRFKPPTVGTGEPSVGTRQFVSWLSNLSVGLSGKDELYIEDSDRMWKLKAGVQITSANFHHAPGAEQQAIQITINESGHRGPSVNESGHRGPSVATKDTDALRILCMGDSNFFGYPLDDEHVFPAALKRALEQNLDGRPVIVTNGGCPGYTVGQGWKWYESTFSEHEFDVLLLSYLNNDAWQQPYSDQELQHRGTEKDGAFLAAASKLRTVQWLRSLSEKSPEEYVPRVSLDDFEATYQNFITTADQKNAQTIILDFRAYPNYEAYSRQLQTLASKRVQYFAVRDQAYRHFSGPQPLRRFSKMLPVVEKRWGKSTLEQYPYLWFYAEFHPEHLNEIGARWLAEQTAVMIARSTQPHDKQKAP